MAITNTQPDTQRVVSRDEFVQQVRALAQAYRETGSTWPNRDLGAFLEAAAAWVEDMDGYYANQGEAVPEALSWQVFTDILHAARVYE